jgi:photosystem II stability/assembly factor-like uncharacterized protein
MAGMQVRGNARNLSGLKINDARQNEKGSRRGQDDEHSAVWRDCLSGERNPSLGSRMLITRIRFKGAMDMGRRQTDCHMVKLALRDITILYLALLMANAPIYASNKQWVSEGPDGGGVNALTIDPSDSQTVYASTDGGIFKSTDGGAAWSAINTGLTDTNVRALALDPSDSQTVYAGTDGGVFMSTDGGVTWSAINAGLTWVSALAIDPSNSQTVYAAGSGVSKSTDGGVSWRQLNTGLAWSDSGYTLAIDPSNSQTVYAAGGGVSKSTDGGAAWSVINAGLADIDVSILTIDASAHQTVYAGTWPSGVLKSTDGGANWSAINAGLAASAVSVLAIDPSDSETVYAGADVGVFKSTDQGARWTATNAGTDPFIDALAIDPSDSQTVYAGSAGGRGVLKSTDGGVSWTAVNIGLTDTHVRALAIDPSDSQTVYAGADVGVFKSTDGGAAWSAINAGLTDTDVSVLAFDPSDSQTIYAGTDVGVFKSTSGGAAWSAINAGLTSAWVPALAIDPSAHQTVYAGTVEGLFKSTDGGVRWTAINTGLTNTNVRALAIDPSDSQTVYAGTLEGLFKSTDGGSTWSAIDTGMINKRVYALAIDAYSQTIYAGTDGSGVWAYSPGCSSVSAGGVSTCQTPGTNATTQTGYAKLALNAGSNPYGSAVFSFKQNGMTVSEAGVPASPPTTRARIFVDYRANVNSIPTRSSAGTVDVKTGIAIENNGSATANINYTLRDLNGITMAVGHGTIGAGQHFGKFIDQLKDVALDFNLPSNFQSAIQFGSLEIASDQPVSVLALRGTVNQRDEFLMATAPVADLTQSIHYSPIYFPQLVDGGGYTTSLVLLNTSNTTEKGTLQILDKNGAPLVVSEIGGTANSSFRYSIPSGGAFRLQTDGSPPNTNAGWVKLIPDMFSPTPIGSGVFSYSPGSILLSESGIPSTNAATHARVYLDLSGNHNVGLAIANIGTVASSIAIAAYQTDGTTSAGTSQGPLTLAAGGHDAKFADQLISGLPVGFKGVLDISSTTPFAALTLRSLTNERNEFLMTTLPVADLNQAAPSPIVFPQIADGGGYVTQFILISSGQAASTTLSYYDENGTPTHFGN